MVHTELPEKFIILIFNKVVITDTATDKNLLYLVNCTDFAEKLKIISMVNLGIFTNIGEEALLFLAGAAL